MLLTMTHSVVPATRLNPKYWFSLYMTWQLNLNPVTTRIISYELHSPIIEFSACLFVQKIRWDSHKRVTSSNDSSALRGAEVHYEIKAISWVDLCLGLLPGDCGLGETTANLFGDERDERQPSEVFWNSLRDATDKYRKLNAVKPHIWMHIEQ